MNHGSNRERRPPSRKRRWLSAGLALGFLLAFIPLQWRCSPTDPPALHISRETTLVTSPTTPDGNIDFAAVIGCDDDAEQKRLELVERLRAIDTESCEPLSKEDVSWTYNLEGSLRICGTLRERFRAASEVSSSVARIVPRLRCSCEQSGKEDRRIVVGAMLRVARLLSTANNTVLFAWHGGLIRVIAECPHDEGLPWPSSLGAGPFTSASRHLALMQLVLVEEIVRSHRSKAGIDINQVLRRFNQLFEEHQRGAPIPAPVRDAWWRNVLRAPEENTAILSETLARVYAGLGEDDPEHARDAEAKARAGLEQLGLPYHH